MVRRQDVTNLHGPVHSRASLASLEVGGAQLPTLEHQYQLPPVVDEVLGLLRADSLGDQRSQLAVQSRQLAAREVAVPGIAVTRLDLDEPNARERRSGLGHVRHVVGNALEAEVL